MKNTSLVSVEWLKENFKNEDLIVLDASPSSNKSGLVPEFPDLKIKDALPFDMERIFVDINNPIPNMFPSIEVFETEVRKLGISNSSIIVVYDNLGIYTSPRARWMFKTFGHNYVYVLDGGLSAWQKAGLPCEPREFSLTKSMGDFKAEYDSSMVVSADEVLKNIDSQQSQVCDARGAVRFNAEGPEPRPGMKSGHIPKSKNVPFKSVLADGKMKSTSELVRLFNEVDVNENIIFSCGSGITACVIMLAAEQIGKGKKTLYDGSWVEWGTGDFPVEK